MNNAESKVAIQSLLSTLGVFNIHGKRLILDMLERSLGVSLVADDADVSKEKIEIALKTILGPHVSGLLIQDWNNKIQEPQALM